MSSVLCGRSGALSRSQNVFGNEIYGSVDVITVHRMADLSATLLKIRSFDGYYL